MSIRENVEDLNAKILRGEILEAFEKHYADDVVMQENELPPTVGKDANREREREFLANIVEFRGAEVKSVAIGEGIAMIEWFFDYTHRQWGKKTYHQVAAQRWKDGKIVHERFYYGS
ncbi:MAG: nuclear transport factor 2 family protein [Deltaproteobacteria bacterium]